MKTKVLLSAFLLCCVLISYGQWSYTNLSYPTCQMGATSLGNKAYFAGGLYESSGNYYYNSRVEIYDFTNGTWSIGNLSFARQFPAAVACGSKVFFAGGTRFPDVYSMVDIYDTITKQWIVSNLSEPRFAAAAVAIGNKVLFAGGANLQAGSSSNVVDIYDITTAQWSKQYLTVPRCTSGVVIGQKAYFVGGFDLTDPINVVDIYDAATDSWSTTTLPDARIFSGVGAIGNKILVAGGMTDLQDSLSASNRVDIYDVNTSTWTIEYLSAARAFGGVATAGNKVFFAGGGNLYGTEAYWTSSSNIVDIYDGITGQWTVEQMSVQRVNHAVTGAGDYFLAAGGLSLSPDVLHSSVEIYHDPTLINIPADYPTIQAGINAATPGDTVLVADGLYYENINFMGKKPLFVSSHFLLDGDTNHINNTIINGSQPAYPALGSVVSLRSGEDTTSVLCGFTITGGTGTIESSVNYRMGGGVQISFSGAKLLNNYIRDNTVSFNNYTFGGGIQVGGPITEIPWVVLRNNRIWNNTAQSTQDFGSGGGIICFYNLIMTDNEISNNTAIGHMGGDGGGVEIVGGFGPIEINVRNNKISHNKALTDLGTSNYAGLGGGMCVVANCSGKIANNVISFNTVGTPNAFLCYAPGVFIQEIIANDFVFENNIITENIANAINCRGGGLTLFRTGGKYQNNVIQDNNASYGGGISIAYTKEVSKTAVLINNTVTGNAATYGGGIHLISGDAVLINSIIWDNTATMGPSIYELSSTLNVRYSDVKGTTVWPGEGNVNCNATFLEDGFHLSPSCQLVEAGIASILINGTYYNCPVYDIDGESRPLNAKPEIGADEVLLVSISEPIPSDSFKLYPNPAGKHVTITLKDGVILSEINIYNQLGQNVFKGTTDELTLDISKLSPGMYIVELISGQLKMREKLVVE